MTAAGELRHLIRFERRAITNPDGDFDLGNTDGPFEDQFTVAAKVKAKFGGEAVTSARLQSQQPVTIVVRQSYQTRLIKEDWRAVDARSGIRYEIKSIVDPDDRRAWLELLCQTGVAA